MELNNQAKHSVTNGMVDRWRVHLIFDYVDNHPISRFLLSPGEEVRQTRRSIDLAREEGSRRIPTFIVLGAQKCGTTSMYEHICSHPLVLKGARRETHYLDWRWDVSLEEEDTESHQKSYAAYYREDALRKYPSLATGESTPSYLLHGDVVIPRLQRVCPWARLVVMLRDPTARAYSQYQMCIDPTGTPEQLAIRGRSSYIGKSFAQVVQDELSELEALGITVGVLLCVFD